MSKPDWKDAPEWANFLAKDADGRWFWFEDEPYPGGSEWLICGLSRVRAVDDIEWNNTLERRP